MTNLNLISSPAKVQALKDLIITASRICSLLLCLFLFICSLSFLSDSFRILGGKNIGALFTNSDLLKNPIVGVMIGVLVTVLVQSSSTSTSIIVGLVSAGAPVRTAIPMIMGANIGTSVTNIIVALTQAGDREQFRKAFACANVHDMFNWLSAFILVIVETLTGYLEKVTGSLVANLHQENSVAPGENVKSPDFLKALTKPLTKILIQLDKKVLKGWAQNDPYYENTTTVLKVNCHDANPHIGEPSCKYLFAFLGEEGLNIGETWIGISLLGISLCMLCGCLIGMVKILNSLIGGQVKGIIENVINADIPIRGLGWLTGYLAMILGAIMTILVQSSSVFTSTLTPLAGAGLISLERAYPLTLGSNLGTTTTSILASFAAGGDKVQNALQIALVHLFFNLTGILMFYPIPFMRWPISIARVLGNTTAQYRWFAVVYLVFMFFIFPLSMFCLSMAGPIPLYIVMTLVLTTIIFAVTVTQLQDRAPGLLPRVLKTWELLPLPLHSLDPWDRMVVRALNCCCTKKNSDNDDLDEVIVKGDRNPSEMPIVKLQFPKVMYNKLESEEKHSRQRSSNSFSISQLSAKQLPSRQRSSNSFSHSTPSSAFTDVSYNRLPAHQFTPTPTPSPGTSTPENTQGTPNNLSPRQSLTGANSKSS